MNVFEDLIVELKAENLLESTNSNEEEDFPTTEGDLDSTRRTGNDQELSSNEVSAVESVSISEPALERNDASPTIPSTEQESSPKSRPVRNKNGREFYHKRAVSEVSSLQMVEHVLTGVEREYMKIVPNTFDDFNAKKALHAFLNVGEAINSEENAAAEFSLMQETEQWCTALAERDRDIPVSSLRLYCENSRPALSSQALVALARFYRNLPFSESVRSKFDFTVTRLFSRPTENERRTGLFKRTEVLVHIDTLYKEWSSIPLYTADDDESGVLLTALSFEELAAEAEAASNFDELIKTDFFGRLRLFKESISELFFAPEVIASAIECNIRVGNAYVDLIAQERSKMDDESVESKYGNINDQSASDAAARTLKLVDLLRSSSRTAMEKEISEHVQPVSEDAGHQTPAQTEPVEPPADKSTQKAASLISRLTVNALSVNKWLLVTAIILITASVGLWTWANYLSESEVSTAGVQTVDVHTSFLREQLTTARISSDTLYGLLQPSWYDLPRERRQEFLQKVLDAGKEHGYTKVHLIGKDGRMAGFASQTRVEVIMY